MAKMPAVRVHGCALPFSAPTIGGEVMGVLPARVPDGPAEGYAQRAPAPLHRYLDVTVYYALVLVTTYKDWLDQSFAVTHFPVWVISLGVAIDAKLWFVLHRRGCPLA